MPVEDGETADYFMIELDLLLSSMSIMLLVLGGCVLESSSCSNLCL